MATPSLHTSYHTTLHQGNGTVLGQSCAKWWKSANKSSLGITVGNPVTFRPNPENVLINLDSAIRLPSKAEEMRHRRIVVVPFWLPTTVLTRECVLFQVWPLRHGSQRGRTTDAKIIMSLLDINWWMLLQLGTVSPSGRRFRADHMQKSKLWAI